MAWDPPSEEVVGAAARARPSLFWPGVLTGIGLAGTLDEVVLYQLLGWHHFNDRSTPTVGLVSDGLFHLFSTAVLVIGIIQLVERRRTSPPTRSLTRLPWPGPTRFGTLRLRRRPVSAISASPSGVVVAHPTRNRKVVGSNPTSGSKTAGQRACPALLTKRRQPAVIPWVGCARLRHAVPFRSAT
jgi:hypothetical protein